MPLSRTFASQAHGQLAPSSTSTESARGAMDFGFPASYVRVSNDRAAAVFVRFDTTTPSTDGYRTCAGESFEVRGALASQVVVASTTTSTGTFVRVLALGG